MAILSGYEPSSLGSIPTNAHVADVEGAAQLFLEAAIQFDIIDHSYGPFEDYAALLLPDGMGVKGDLRAKLESYMSAGGRLILSGTAAPRRRDGEFGLSGVPVVYEGQAPTVPSYLRLDEALAGETELATDYDYVFYNRAHLVRPPESAKAREELRSALFDRTWEHFTSHAQAPVGESLDSPLVVGARVSVLRGAALRGLPRP